MKKSISYGVLYRVVHLKIKQVCTLTLFMEVWQMYWCTIFLKIPIWTTDWRFQIRYYMSYTSKDCEFTSHQSLKTNKGNCLDRKWKRKNFDDLHFAILSNKRKCCKFCNFSKQIDVNGAMSQKLTVHFHPSAFAPYAPPLGHTLFGTSLNHTLVGSFWL